MLKTICVVTPNYPSPGFIERGAFVEDLVRSWEKIGLSIQVIAPRTVSNEYRSWFKRKSTRIRSGRISEPIILTLGAREVWFVSFKRLSRLAFYHSVKKEFKKLGNIQALYGKFLFGGGAACYHLFLDNGLPYFIDIGESNLYKDFGRNDLELAKAILKNAAGVICVSDILLEEVRKLGVAKDKSITIKNSVNKQEIFPLKREFCRKELGLNENVFIAIFVGHFTDRKGPLRVLEAVNRFNGQVKAVFLGRGEQTLHGKNILYQGSVDRKELNLWLNASDIFVLPTLAEGHCNAINEAIACGLPIISSDIPEVRWQLRKDVNGILINPNSVDQIFDAINCLYKNPSVADSMRNNNLRESLSSVSRAEAILSWMNKRILEEGNPS